MIPIIIGAAAAAVAAGAGYALGKKDTPKKVVVNNVIQKAEVSEDYVKWQLDRAGKNIETPAQTTPSTLQRNSSSSMSFTPSGDYDKDFERIKNFFADSSVSNEFISGALDVLEYYAQNVLVSPTALDYSASVEKYREKLRNRRR